MENQIRYGKLHFFVQSRSRFYMPPVQTVFNDTETVEFLGSKTWELVLDEMKQLQSLREFRKADKQ